MTELQAKSTIGYLSNSCTSCKYRSL